MSNDLTPRVILLGQINSSFGPLLLDTNGRVVVVSDGQGLLVRQQGNTDFNVVQQTLAHTDTTAAVTATASQPLATNTIRRRLLMRNTGAQNIFFNFGGTATAVAGRPFLLPNESLILDNPAPTNALSVICAAGQTSTLWLLTA